MNDKTTLIGYMEYNINKTIELANKLVGLFENQIKDVPYERKGILFSEMLFLQATATPVKPKKILESGRARGQSTYMLCMCFPDAKIISVEYDPHSPDVPIANNRLQKFDNLELLFGDSRDILPKYLQSGDVVVIDGPKGFRAVKLALRLLRDNKPALVFIHDTPKGLRERIFLEHNMDCFFSDNDKFVEQFSYLDNKCKTVMSALFANNDYTYTMKTSLNKSYGPTLACIPCSRHISYRWLLIKLNIVSLVSRLKNSFRKRLSSISGI